MRLYEIDSTLTNENKFLTFLGNVGKELASDYAYKTVRDQLPTFRKGGYNQTSSRTCQKVNGRMKCDHSANIGYDLPTIEPARARQKGNYQRPRINAISVDTRRRTR